MTNVFIDFETEPARKRPDYPPKPVGVAIRVDNQRSKYLAWGHPTKNNSTREHALDVLERYWLDDTTNLVMWSAKFDLEVGRVHLDLPWPKLSRVHDALWLAFLDDPHALDLGLKPTAHRLLGIEPEEEDELRSWLREHQPVPNKRFTKTSAKPAEWAAYMPGNLVGRYARGDVDRTARIFNQLLRPVTVARSMGEAYDRERRLLYPLLRMEPHGVRVDVRRLQRDIKAYRRWMVRVDAWIRRRIKAGESLNINAPQQLVQAMIKAGKYDEKKAGVTPKSGQPKADRRTIQEACTDTKLVEALRYHGQLKTYLGTFMEPWLTTASETGGLIYTAWSSTRQDEATGAHGARTGRLASSPNFQNIPKRREEMTASPLKDLPALPYPRSYIVPFSKHHTLLDRDYNQQELRLLAHFEDGALIEAYDDDPWLDFHTNAQTLINNMLGTSWDRRPVKNTVFGLIYGMGVGTLAEKNGITVKESRTLKEAVLSSFEGIRALYREMRRRAIANEPLRTWGGREYFVEEPRFVRGRWRTFDYKLVNVLIQGSAADIIKEAVIRYDEMKLKDEKLLLTVHDEILASVPTRSVRPGMERLRRAMEFDALDVPLLSEGTTSDKHWSALKTYDKRGEVKAA